MRTIKFRGKRTDNGEWVYGDLTKLITPEGNVGYFIITENKGDFRDDVPVNSISYTLYNDIFLVSQSSVGQFTGLHDREGKEIYEGDIVSMLTKRFGEEIFIIAYEDSHLGAFVLCEGDVHSSFICVFGKNYGYEPYYCEVVGNIHDNPELIEKRE